MTTTLGIGVIGMGWMGMAHSRGYRAIPDRYWDGGIRPRLVICADDLAGARPASAGDVRLRGIHHRLARGHQSS
jgi:hypothetical protein